jgi:putative endonuclease
MKTDNWIVYILKMNDDSLYTGATNNLKQRIEKHMNGNGSKYVRSRLPIKKVYSSSIMTKSEALKLEYKIKKLKKEDKIKELFKNVARSSSS